MDQKPQAWRTGSLPEQAPLAAAYIPMHREAAPTYDTELSLSRGTLFPGLDLPFMNVVNDPMPMSPIKELMAIDFVTKELELYLDTHQYDMEAFTLYQTMLALGKEARERYVAQCGALQQRDLLGMGGYGWIDGPWPWEYRGKKEG